MKNHALARGLGVFIALALTALLVTVDCTPFLVHDANGYGFVFGGLIAAIIAVPLLALIIGITVYLKTKGAANTALMVTMWAPVLVSASVLPVYLAVQRGLTDMLEDAHPFIDEVHVNLSGRDLWTDPDTGQEAQLKAAHPETFHSFLRWPRRDPSSDKLGTYSGSAFAPGFTTLKVFSADPAKGNASVMPVVVMPAPAAWAGFSNRLGATHAGKMRYFYYYYPNRVEVTRAVNWGQSEDRRTPDGEPIVDFYLHHLGSTPIARLEINGQPVSSDSAFLPLSGEDCRTFAEQAIGRSDGTVKLRWQYAQADPAWHEATVTIPAFRHMRPQKGSPDPEFVDLFFQPDGSVAAQRAQFVRMGADAAGLRYTDPALISPPPAVCGTAANRYTSFIERMPD